MFAPKVTTLIEQLENILRSFFKVKHLDSVAIEKYRWNNPDVTASWQWKEDELKRNINLMVSEDGQRVSFEANAWLDNDVTLKRRWIHKPFGTMWIGQLSETELNVAVGITLEKIFNEITAMDRSGLSNISDLRPLP